MHLDPTSVEPEAVAGKRALFLDRDGTIIHDRDYLADPAGVELIAGTTEALRCARKLGYRLQCADATADRSRR